MTFEKNSIETFIPYFILAINNMDVFDLKRKKLSIPLFDIGALTAGAYIGYLEGQGVEITDHKENLLKYGPASFVLIYTPLFIKLNDTFVKWSVKKLKTKLKDGELIVKYKDSERTVYNKLSKDKKDGVKRVIETTITTLDSKINDCNYLRPTLKKTTRIAVETGIGYVVGRLYGQFI